MKKLRVLIVAIMALATVLALSACNIDVNEIVDKAFEQAELSEKEIEEIRNSSSEEGYKKGYAEGKTAGKDEAESELSAKLKEEYDKGYAEGVKSQAEGYDFTMDTIGMEIHFIDVGQGDAIVVRFADGTDIVVDAGSGTNEKNAVTNEYIAYLNSIEIGKIDYVIATHAHSDHMNMLDNLLDNFEVANIWYNGYDVSPTQKFFTDFESKAVSEGANIVKFDGDGDTYQLKTGTYAVTVYAPGYDAFSDVNYESPIILVEYAGVKVLLTGDAEEDAERWFMNKVGGTSLDVDVLKVGHHGSKKGTCPDFLDFITPEFAVISAGDGNSYDHPTPETMNDLFDAGVITYRTDRQGNIVLKVDGDGDYMFYVENFVPTENNRLWLKDRMQKIGE